MGRLNTFVSVDGNWYGPDSDLPDDVAEKISNPKVWTEGSAPRELDIRKRADGFELPEVPEAPEKAKEPPRGGPGSSADAWRTYAQSLKVDVPEGASAKEIAALVDEHKAQG